MTLVVLTVDVEATDVYECITVRYAHEEVNVIKLLAEVIEEVDAVDTLVTVVLSKLEATDKLVEGVTDKMKRISKCLVLLKAIDTYLSLRFSVIMLK